MRMQDWQEYRSTALASHDLATAILRAKGYPPPPPPKIPPSPRRRKSRAKPAKVDLTRGPTTEAIKCAVANHFGLTPEALLERSNKWSIAHPRQIAFYLVRELTPRSLPDIGRRFGGFDHTTVMHGVRQIERRRQYDADLAADIEALRERLAG